MQWPHSLVSAVMETGAAVGAGRPQLSLGKRQGWGTLEKEEEGLTWQIGQVREPRQKQRPHGRGVEMGALRRHLWGSWEGRCWASWQEPE